MNDEDVFNVHSWTLDPSLIPVYLYPLPRLFTPESTDMDGMQMRQPDKKEMMAMLKANVCVFTVYCAAIRLTPLVS